MPQAVAQMRMAISVASTVGITVGIFGTIVYKFYRKLRFGISMFD